MTINAIPTVYKDIRFRSRLEARWAAFFDALALEWTYEPCDLRGYVPDFHVTNRAAGYAALLVEVKGCSSETELRDHVEKLELAGVTGPAMLVGENPLIVLGRDDVPRVAWDIVIPVWEDATYVVGMGGCFQMDQSIRRAWARACNATQWRGPR